MDPLSLRHYRTLLETHKNLYSWFDEATEEEQINEIIRALNHVERAITQVRSTLNQND